MQYFLIFVTIFIENFFLKLIFIYCSFIFCQEFLLFHFSLIKYLRKKYQFWHNNPIILSSHSSLLLLQLFHLDISKTTIIIKKSWFSPNRITLVFIFLTLGILYDKGCVVNEFFVIVAVYTHVLIWVRISREHFWVCYIYEREIWWKEAAANGMKKKKINNLM